MENVKKLHNYIFKLLHNALTLGNIISKCIQYVNNLPASKTVQHTYYTCARIKS